MQDILPGSGVRGLYTSTLFRFAPAFFRALGPAVELGRPFISPEFQKDYAPLLLLWQAIGRAVAARPEAPVLFGPVSISTDYSEASRQLIVEFLRKRRFRADLARWVSPRKPFHSRLMRAAELRAVAACLDEVEDLSARISDIEEHSGVAVLFAAISAAGWQGCRISCRPRFFGYAGWFADRGSTGSAGENAG
jgi:hypothetical protein